MSKDDFVDDLIRIGLVAGSIWLGAKFLKNLSNKCPNCDTPLEPNQDTCSRCGYKK